MDVRVLELPKNWAVGQRAEVYIETARKTGVTVLPTKYILWRDGKPGVLVRQGQRAAWRDLTLGLSGREVVEVVAGLEPGDWVVVPADGKNAGHRRSEDFGAMNLAAKDIQHNLGRFALTVFGIGMLLMIVMGMGGIYRGLVEDATLLVERIGADLWVVQRDTRGPFAEVSRVPKTLVYRVLAVPGVESAREFVFHTIQRQHNGKPLRMSVLGLSWPLDKGEWLPLIAGRPLAQNHYEMVADKTLGLRLHERIKLGKETYTIVGITSGMASTAGDGMIFVTVWDSQAIQFDTPGEAIRLERAARERRSQTDDIFLSQPMLTEQLSRPAAELPAVASPELSAVVVRVAPGADPDAVAATIVLLGRRVGLHARPAKRNSC